MDAGRVDERDLGGRAPGDSEDARPGRLGLVGDDRDLLPDERVDQRGLARVRPPDDGDLPHHGRRRSCSLGADARGVLPASMSPIMSLSDTMG